MLGDRRPLLACAACAALSCCGLACAWNAGGVEQLRSLSSERPAGLQADGSCSGAAKPAARSLLSGEVTADKAAIRGLNTSL